MALAYSLSALNWAATERSPSCRSLDTLAYRAAGVSGCGCFMAVSLLSPCLCTLSIVLSESASGIRYEHDAITPNTAAQYAEQYA